MEKILETKTDYNLYKGKILHCCCIRLQFELSIFSCLSVGIENKTFKIDSKL